MTKKQKIIFTYPFIIGPRNICVKRIAKKIKKDNNEKYSEQWKNDYAVKKSKKFAKTLGIIIEVIGFEYLPKNGGIIAPNHASLFDPGLILLALRDERVGNEYPNKQAVFIAKDDLMKNKRVKHYGNLINTFYVSRKNPREALKTLDEFAKFAKDNKKFAVIFPEGSRTKDGNIQEFKSGAFRAAKILFMPIIPVTINNSVSTTDLSRKSSEKVIVQVIFHKPIKPISIMAMSVRDISLKVQKIVSSKYIKSNIKQSSAERKLV